MGGAVYFYYDKVLVADCCLGTLREYVGTIPGDSALQLITYPRGMGENRQVSPGRTAVCGDFYLAAVSEEILYQIHRDGRLIRAYAPDLRRVEESILGMPMTVLAALQGKLLLQGAALLAGGCVYGILGDTRSWGDLLCGGPLLVGEEGSGYVGALPSFPGGDEVHIHRHPRIFRLRGIVVLEAGGQREGLVPVEEPEERRRLLLENYAGLSCLPEDLRRRAADGLLDGVSRRVPMAYLHPDCFGKDVPDREALLELLGRLPRPENNL